MSLKYRPDGGPFPLERALEEPSIDGLPARSSMYK